MIEIPQFKSAEAAGRTRARSPAMAEQEVRAFRDIAHAVVHGKSIGEIIDAVLNIMYRSMGMVRGSLIIRQSNVLSIEKIVGLKVGKMDHLGMYSLNGVLSGNVGNIFSLRVVTEAELSRLFPNKVTSCNYGRNTVHVQVPLWHRTLLIGMLEYDCSNSPEFSPESSATLLEIVGGVVADVSEARSHQRREYKQLVAENLKLRSLVDDSGGNELLVGSSREMRELASQISKAAPTDATVLIRGASGTGKELVARAIVAESDRAGKPFVAFSCAALPDTLIESELFGHEKGAFTGAIDRRIGRAEAANGGTLFLDEIGDLSPATQVKLLRFLQSRTFSRLGSNEELHADVRFIAATSRNLEDLMARHLFREDLYYRLNIFSLAIPPLSERHGDIIELADHFIEKFNDKYGKHVRALSPEVSRLLVSHAWPGNVRELENCIERAVLVARGQNIEIGDLPLNLIAAARESGAAPGAESAGEIARAHENGDTEGSETPSIRPLADAPLADQLKSFERAVLTAAIRAHAGNFSAAARDLGISPRIIYYRAHRLGIQ